MGCTWGKQGTSELNQTNDRGSKTEYGTNRTKDYQNKTGNEKPETAHINLTEKNKHNLT